MNYGDLQTNFTNLLNRRDCTTAQAQSFLQQAIVRAQRELRVPALEKTLLVTVGSNWVGLPIPTDFLELIDIYDTSVNQIAQQRCEKTDLTRAIELAANVGTPQVYCRQGGYWILGPAPTLGDVIQINYYGEVATVANPTDTNILLTIAWDLVMYGGLSLACDYFNDKRKGSQLAPGPDGQPRIVDGFEGRYNQIKDQLQNMAEVDDASGAVSVQPAYTYPDNYGIEDYDVLNWVP